MTDFLYELKRNPLYVLWATILEAGDLVALRIIPRRYHETQLEDLVAFVFGLPLVPFLIVFEFSQWLVGRVVTGVLSSLSILSMGYLPHPYLGCHIRRSLHKLVHRMFDVATCGAIAGAIVLGLGFNQLLGLSLIGFMIFAAALNSYTYR